MTRVASSDDLKKKVCVTWVTHRRESGRMRRENSTGLNFPPFGAFKLITPGFPQNLRQSTFRKTELFQTEIWLLDAFTTHCQRCLRSWASTSWSHQLSSSSSAFYWREKSSLPGKRTFLNPESPSALAFCVDQLTKPGGLFCTFLDTSTNSLPSPTVESPGPASPAQSSLSLSCSPDHEPKDKPFFFQHLQAFPFGTPQPDILIHSLQSYSSRARQIVPRRPRQERRCSSASSRGAQMRISWGSWSSSDRFSDLSSASFSVSSTRRLSAKICQKSFPMFFIFKAPQILVSPFSLTATFRQPGWHHSKRSMNYRDCQPATLLVSRMSEAFYFGRYFWVLWGERKKLNAKRHMNFGKKRRKMFKEDVFWSILMPASSKATKTLTFFSKEKEHSVPRPSTTAQTSWNTQNTRSCLGKSIKCTSVLELGQEWPKVTLMSHSTLKSCSALCVNKIVLGELQHWTQHLRAQLGSHEWRNTPVLLAPLNNPVWLSHVVQLVTNTKLEKVAQVAQTVVQKEKFFFKKGRIRIIFAGKSFSF